jgi:hypothetical protein
VARDDGKSPEAHLRMKARMPGGPRKKITSLAVMVKAIERGLWPTPTARDGRTLKGGWDRKRQGGKSLAQTMLDAGHSSGRLNPTWVEWLMGFPAKHTDLEH